MFGISENGFQKLARFIKGEDLIEGGLAEDTKKKFNIDQLIKGLKVEMEHTDDPRVAIEIAMDHLTEMDDYYDRLEKVEDK